MQNTEDRLEVNFINIQKFIAESSEGSFGLSKSRYLTDNDRLPSINITTLQTLIAEADDSYRIVIDELFEVFLFVYKRS